MDPQVSSTKAATVHRLGHCYIVHPASTGKRGYTVCAPLIVLPRAAPPRALVDAMLKSLSLSHVQWPPHPDTREERAGFLRAAKIRSWKEYDPESLIEVSQDESGKIRMEPMVRDGPGHGPLRKRAITVPPNATAERLDQKLMQAINESASAYKRK